MNDCLVTRLKGVVNNSNLPYLGELDFTLYPYGDKVVVFNSTEPANWKTDRPVIVDGTAKTEGVFTGELTIHTVDGETNPVAVKLWSKYNLSNVVIAAGTDLKVEELYNDDVIVRLAAKGQCLGDLRNYDKTIKLDCDSLGACSIPFLKNFIGYDKLEFVQTPVSIEMYLGPNSTSGQPDSFIAEYVGSGTLESILENQTIKEHLRVIEVNLPKVSVNLNAFKNCPQIVGFYALQCPRTGTLLEAFGTNTSMAVIALTPNGTQEELSNLFNAWKSNGKRSSTTTFVYATNVFLINGNPSPETFNVVFDGNGDWTIVIP